MIHAYPARMPYVEKYLLPSLLQQGIDRADIDIYVDWNSEGNLKSTIKSFEQLLPVGRTWHLQDDVVISKNFKKLTAEFKRDQGNICCGFASVYDEAEPGIVKPENMWYSFPCICIPNVIANDFGKWIEEKADDNYSDGKFFVHISNNMFDDFLHSKRFLNLQYYDIFQHAQKILSIRCHFPVEGRFGSAPWHCAT